MTLAILIIAGLLIVATAWCCAYECGVADGEARYAATRRAFEERQELEQRGRNL